jgi:putative membrane protein
MILAKIVALVVALEHVLFMVMETFLWTTPKVRKIFGQSAEGAETTKLLAANQGVYNGALALVICAAVAFDQRFCLRMMLGFVIVVGVYGGVTVKRTILFVQALPAIIALALTYEH